MIAFVLNNNAVAAQIPGSNIATVTILPGASNPNTPNGFSPSSIFISAGQTVNWTNNDSVSHTVTSISQIFQSDIIRAGDSFFWTFDKPSYYKYYCQIHPFMSGAVVVD